MSVLNDSKIISAYLAGDESALKLLIDKHSERVYGFIFSKLYDRTLTEDIFQETFTKVIVSLKEGRYNEEGKFLPWVMRIAHNLVIDHFRAKKKMPVINEISHGYEDDLSIFDIISDPSDSVETEMIVGQIHADVMSLIELLPDDQREVLKLRMFKGLSFKEIAEDTDVSINTALGRMRYALINLRKFVKENNMSLTRD